MLSSISHIETIASNRAARIVHRLDFPAALTNGKYLSTTERTYCGRESTIPSGSGMILYKNTLLVSRYVSKIKGEILEEVIEQ